MNWTDVRMKPLPKLLTYFALIAGAAVFLLPLLWMLSTALKPLEQTTVQPPIWLPRRYYIEENNTRREVKLGAVVSVPSVWVTPLGATVPVVLPQADVDDGVWTTMSGRKTPWTCTCRSRPRRKRRGAKCSMRRPARARS